MSARAKSPKPDTKTNHAVAPSKRRLTGAARRQSIVTAAATLFAERGFEGTTRDIAAALGVSQALLYRYFPSKDELITAVYDDAFGARWQGGRDNMLSNPGLTLEQVLCRFYGDHVASSDATRTKLFVRAGLAGLPFPGVRGATMTDQIFAPIVTRLRGEAGLPSLEARPMMRGEREMCMQLHSSVMFIGIRRHVYGMQMPDDLADVVALYVRQFVAGAPTVIRQLHVGGAGMESLTVQQLHPGGRGGRPI